MQFKIPCEFKFVYCWSKATFVRWNAAHSIGSEFLIYDSWFLTSVFVHLLSVIQCATEMFYFGVMKAEKDWYKQTKTIINILGFSENIVVRVQCVVINWLFWFYPWFSFLFSLTGATRLSVSEDWGIKHKLIILFCKLRESTVYFKRLQQEETNNAAF